VKNIPQSFEEIIPIDIVLHQTRVAFVVSQDFSMDVSWGRVWGVSERTGIHRVWFHPAVAGDIKEKISHESQKIHAQPDGSIIFKDHDLGVKSRGPGTGVFEQGNLCPGGLV
jgi:hypothetical protein